MGPGRTGYVHCKANAFPSFYLQSVSPDWHTEHRYLIRAYLYRIVPLQLQILCLAAPFVMFGPNNILSYMGASLVIAVCVFYFLKSKLIRKESTVGSTG
jgi:hypothetical protein